MKKLLVLVTALMVVFAVTAQENKVQKEVNSFIVFNLGPSFPVGDYASTDENNDDAGFAKTGFNFDLTYGYNFVKNVGLGVSAFYANHKLSNKLTQEVVGAKVDHFQYYGLMAGPFINQKMGTKAEIGIGLMAGIANVNSPKLVYEGETFVTEDWAAGFIWSGKIDMKFNMPKNTFILLRLDYAQTEPEFTIDVFGETIKAKQNISVLNLNAGFGFRF